MAVTRTKDPGVLAWLHLVRVHDKVDRLVAERLGRFDLTLAQFDVLANLIAKQGISQQTLSEGLLVTKGNICGLIDRLESRGLVERRCHPVDRRQNLLYLTEKGQALAEEVVPAVQELIGQKMEALSADEKQTLNILLRDLDRSLTR